MNDVKPGTVKIFDPTGPDVMRFYPGSRLAIRRWLGDYPYHRAMQYATTQWDSWYGDLLCFPCVTVTERPGKNT